MSEKLLGFYRLVDACAGPGCPVCRCLLADSAKYLEALLYEHVNDPETRRRLRAAWGFCGWHTWMLGDVAGSAFGSAIISEDMLRVASRRFECGERVTAQDSPRRWRRLLRLIGGGGRPIPVELHARREMCPACRERVDAEERYLHVMLRFADDLEFKNAYGRSGGLCVPHAVRAVEIGPAQQAAVLMARTLPKWAAVRRDLADFIEKHDYRSPRSFTDTDRSVAVRAFETLAGADGLFGSQPRAKGASDGS
jgi:hypothetical protein